jgi:hypothetical protein
MYNSGIVAVVKVNGRILRESKDEVFLPFNSEYSILLKNLESRKCLVNISIDSQDVLDGNSLIIDPNTESELKGFMNGNKVKNRFKFIQKTKEISEHRGDKIDDGIIRIEYRFEQFPTQKQVVITEHWHYNYNPPCNWNCLNCFNNCCNRRYYTPAQTWKNPWNTSVYGSVTSGLSGTSGSSGCSGVSGMSSMRGSTAFTNNNIGSSVNYCSTNDSLLSGDTYFKGIDPLPDEGITVKGSQINQNFNYGNIGVLENSPRVIILKLIGTKAGEIIEKPLTIQSKKECPTCGKKSKSHINFCPACGTFLE